MTILRSFTFYTIILSTILFYKLSAQDQPFKVLYAGVKILYLNTLNHIFAGKFKNVSPDDRKVMIQGEFYRYNAQLNSSFRYDVLRYYERMDAEVRVIKQQMVDSLPTVTTPSSFKNVLLLFGSILLVGILLMSLAGTDYNSTGDGSGGTPVTPA